MRATHLSNLLVFAITNNFPVLIKGMPGVGKSDIVEQACKLAGADLIISHPVVSDPTDYKGLPFVVNGKAVFLPIGDLELLMTATKKTVYLLDDLGQAPPSVQAACMQLILARRINGHKVSDNVVFVACTNRREDKAGVGGLLEPVKSRFYSIVELEVNTDDWVKWALSHNMPNELISFVQWRPELLCNFKPTKDLINSPCPRTVAAVGKMQSKGIPNDLFFDVVKGAVGEEFAVEYQAFIKLYMNLPTVNSIILDPDNALLPTDPASQYALTGALSDKMTPQNIGAIMIYLARMQAEMSVATMKKVATTKPQLCATREFITWASDNAGVIL